MGLGDRVSPTDIEEGMRVGVDRQNKYQIHIPLPPKIDPSVTMMTVEEKPDVTYAEVGGAKDQIQKIREVVELPMLNVQTPCAFALPTCFASRSCRDAVRQTDATKPHPTRSSCMLI